MIFCFYYYNTMQILEKIINKVLLEESVSITDVNDALDNHKRVIINYHTKGEDKATGARVVEVYAYGLTKAGNPVLRCFQPLGDSTTRVPSWKFFRLDRISSWKETNQTFDRPASFFYKGLGEFNPDGDETMSVVYKIAKFGNNKEQNSEINTPQKGPKMKAQPNNNGEVFKTDTEHRMNRLRQQLANPITIDDLKTKEAFKNDNEKPTDDTGPKKKTTIPTGNKKNGSLYKTDTERGMERLRQQLNNPKKIDLDTLRQRLGDTSKPIKYADLVKKMSQDTNNSENNDNDGKSYSHQEIPKSETDNLYKTDTERNMEKLRQQLNNPKKIDLSQFDKRRR